MDKDVFQQTGAISLALPSPGRWLPFLQSQYENLGRGGQKNRPWQYSDLHNPWGRCAALFDSWKFLELCQSAEIMSEITPRLGPDIILYDTQLAPDPWSSGASDQHWACDRLRCPVDPLAGVTVRIAFGPPAQTPRHFIYRAASHLGPEDEKGESSLTIESGRMIIHDIETNYHIESAAQDTASFEFLIRYFPATSRYLRDPSAPVHRALCARYPLQNYARAPIWLAHGTDRAENDFVTGFKPRPGQWITKTPE